MKPNWRLSWLMLVGTLWLPAPYRVWAQDPPEDAASEVALAAGESAWSLDDAMAQLNLYPRDPYLQYVALQLGRRENRSQAVWAEINRLTGRTPQWQERAGQVNLFSLFTGALAVQESLQLDTMIDPAAGTPEGGAPRDIVELDGQGRRLPDRGPGDAQPRVQGQDVSRVLVENLAGPTVESHPWTEMLAGRQPADSPLAGCVPEDFYCVQFRSVNKLLALLEQGDIWGTHLLSQTAQKAYRHEVRERAMSQLALEINPILQPFYDLAVQELAVVGSDLFAVEGSDLTLLFRVQQPQLFQAQLNGFLTRAEQTTPGVERSAGEYRGVPFVHLTTRDRSVHVYSAYPSEDLHIRSNSMVALQRILDMVTRTQGDATKSLGDTDEFKYIRTLLPYGADEEDGLIYLSDAFIRHMVGPVLKLTQSRRRVCLNHLRMMGHAGALYQAEHGRAATSLEELTTAQCTPGTFGEGRLACPCGGVYALGDDGRAACSHHGTADYLIPCNEIPVEEVSSAEAAAYEQFVEQYSQYWRTFFDPIAVRVRVTPAQYRLETIVLPLIDNSLYTSLAMVLGGEPQPLDLPPIPDRAIFSVSIKLNKPALLAQAGVTPPEDEPDGPPVAPADLQRTMNQLRQIGLALHNYHDAHGQFPTSATFDDQQRPLLSWRVHVLPFLGHDELYRKFHLDEPWDSPHNRELIAQMPDVYRSAGAKPAQDGTTRIVVPVGPAAMFRGNASAVKMADVSDGTSNTIMALQVTEKHAVVWTKPEDVPSDFKTVRSVLFADAATPGAVCCVDGSVLFLPGSFNDASLHAVLTRNGGELAPDLDRARANMPRPPRLLRFFGMPDVGLSQRDVYDMVVHGLGDRVGLHTYDADQFFDFQLMGALGQTLGNFAGRRGGGFDSDFAPFVFLAASLNSPVYASIQLEDPQVVDRFLSQIDSVVARVARQRERGGFFQVDTDFYRLPLAGGVEARSFGFQFGPVKWRFFWARLGKTLYVASKPYVLEDLAAKMAEGDSDLAADPTASELKGHAMIRIRPQHWNQVLPGYRLGWAERHRLACLDNVGRLSSVARSVPAGASDASATPDDAMPQLHREAERIYGVRCFCPEGGQYLREGNAVRCSVHGSAQDPRQLAVPADNGAIDTLLRGFSDLTVTLTFLEDGLHAVLLIDR